MFKQSWSANSLPVLTVGAFLVAVLLFALFGLAWISHKFGADAQSIALAVGWVLLAALAIPLARSGSARTAMGVALTVALAMRLGTFAVTGGANTWRADPIEYERLADGILNGTGMVWQIQGFFDLKAAYPPLYPVILSGAYWLVGDKGVAAIALNTAINCVTAALIYAAGKRYGAPREGAAAAYLYLIWPSVVISSAYPSKEGLVSALMLGLVLILGEASRAPARAVRWAPAYGLCAALLTLTQPAIGTLTGLLALILLKPLGARGFLKFCLSGLLFAVIVMLPWWVRNWVLFERFVPLTTAGGLNLYADTVRDLSLAPSAIMHLPEVELTKELGKIGLQWIAAHPVDYLIWKAKAVVIAFGLDHNRIEELQLLRPGPVIAPESFALVTQLSLIGLRCAALWAFWRTRTEPIGQILTIVLAMCLAQMAAVNIWFEFKQSHWVFLVPIFLAWTAIAARRRKAAG